MADALIAVTPALFDRVALQAATIHPLRVLLTLISFPFYALGWLLGMTWVAVLFVAAAVKVGMADARSRVPQRPTAEGST